MASNILKAVQTVQSSTRQKRVRGIAARSPTKQGAGRAKQPQKESLLSKSRVNNDYLKDLIYNGTEKDRSAIELLIADLIDDCRPESIFTLLEIVLYFEHLGDADRAIEVATAGLKQALRIEDLSIQRKAHNIVGFCYSRVGNYEQSLLHLERALQIAINLKDPLFEFAVLCNVVEALQVMGLFENAKSLSIRLTKYPQGTAKLDYLHLQNAINGLKLARRTGDPVYARLFDALAQGKLKSAGPVGQPWRAYVDAHRSLCLLQLGRSTEALNLINEAVSKRPQGDNLRVDIILLCARSLCAVESKNRDLIENSKTCLTGLLEQASNFAPHREEILRTLVVLYSDDETPSGKSLELVYLRRLQEHIVNVKHRQFFRRLNSVDYRNNLKISPPAYELPSLLATVATVGTELENPLEELAAYCVKAEPVNASNLGVTAQLVFPELTRSRGYYLAEEWSVAADFLTERPGQHCFQVGQLAGMVALNLGLSNEEAALISMACRLHDIGKIAICEDLHRAVNAGRVDSYLMIREHTTVGAELLSLSLEPIFVIAAKVARHHHEWWNGCGYPDGLKGTAIPLEARICLLADSYVTLLYPSRDRVAWNPDDAMRQVVSMGGVQLDPGLLHAFVTVIESGNGPGVYGEGRADDIQYDNALNNAKMSLLEVIGSIVN